MNSLLYHLLESTFWSFLFLGCIHFLKIQDSNVRCWIHRIALLKFLFPSVWFVSLLNIQPQQELIPLMIVFAEPIDTITSPEISERSVPYMLYVWGSVIGFMILRSVMLIFRFIKKLKSISDPFEGRNQEFLHAALESMDEPVASIAGYSAQTNLSIGLFGIFRPRIIAKHEFLEVLNDRELTAAFQHEIAHKKRRDNIWRLLIDIVSSLFWFHPIIWYLNRKILIETEKACDEQVISTGQTTNTYANCLLKAAEYAHSETYICSVALSETSIKTRVSNVIHYKKGKQNIMKTVAIVITALGLISGSFTLLASTDTVTPVKDAYSIHDLRPTRQVAPEYPEDLKKLGVNGVVHVKFIVDEEGGVSDITVIDPQPVHPGFIAPTVEALLKWKFHPGHVNDKPVKVLVRVPFVFGTNDNVNLDSKTVDEKMLVLSPYKISVAL